VWVSSETYASTGNASYAAGVRHALARASVGSHAEHGYACRVVREPRGALWAWIQNLRLGALACAVGHIKL
jgi:hypothetical protein